MNPQLEQLVVLQKIDDEIAELKTAQEIIPGQIKSGSSALEEKKKRLEDARNEVKNLQEESKKLEMEVQDENDLMAKAKIKLPSVKTNKEYTAILAETNAIKEKVAKIEDQELEMMEILEEKEKEFPPLEALVKEEDGKFQAYKKQKEEESERIKKEIEEAQGRRQGVIGALEEKWIKSYEKVAKLRGGVAVVSLDESVCKGCFQQILPQVVIEVKTSPDIVHQCQHCSRILYWIEEPRPANVTLDPARRT